MSRTNQAINSIKEDLDSISGLDGIVADILEIMQEDIHNRVLFIRDNFPEANLFNYYGIIPKE